jgi:hypothetical protein
MKLLFSSAIMVLAGLATSYSQSFFPLDKSPMDVAYLPDHFAHDRKPEQQAVIKVFYSRPQMNGREIFGAKVPYGEVWRTGANEAVEFHAYQDIVIGGRELAAGTYSLFTIPGEMEWTIILNSDLDYWGAYSYNEANDVFRVKVPSKAMDQTLEAFSIRFEALGNNSAVMRMAWENALVEIPIGY